MEEAPTGGVIANCWPAGVNSAVAAGFGGNEPMSCGIGGPRAPTGVAVPDRGKKAGAFALMAATEKGVVLVACCWDCCCVGGCRLDGVKEGESTFRDRLFLRENAPVSCRYN